MYRKTNFSSGGVAECVENKIKDPKAIICIKTGGIIRFSDEVIVSKMDSRIGTKYKKIANDAINALI